MLGKFHIVCGAALESETFCMDGTVHTPSTLFEYPEDYKV
jgi:hypothetical protein